MNSLNGVKSIRFVNTGDKIINRVEGDYTFFKLEHIAEGGLYVELVDSVVYLPISVIKNELNKAGYKVVKK